MFDMLPVGLLGLVLAGFLAALMSQIDSTLNSASTLVTMDFVQRWKPGLSSRTLMWVGRSATGVFMILAALWAPQIMKFGSLFGYLQNVLAYLTPPVVATFIWGLFWKRGNATGGFVSLLTGLVAAGLLMAGNLGGWMPKIHYLYVAGILFGFSSIVLVVVSLLGPEPVPEKVEKMTWSRAVYDEETRLLKGQPWYANYRVLSVILLVFTAVVVAFFV
jgi:SSS family solute:Na+ symporter